MSLVLGMEKGWELELTANFPARTGRGSGSPQGASALCPQGQRADGACWSQVHIAEQSTELDGQRTDLRVWQVCPPSLPTPSLPFFSAGHVTVLLIPDGDDELQC